MWASVLLLLYCTPDFLARGSEHFLVLPYHKQVDSR